MQFLINRFNLQTSHSTNLPLFESLESKLMMSGNIIISEFMAVNGDTLDDEDGESSDWIELTNTSNLTTNLAGLHLTDDPLTLNKWTLPAIDIAPGAQIVIFASGKDRANPLNELHTNFKLTSDGEYLALIDTDGQTVIHAFDPEFPNQKLDVSYGIGQQLNELQLINAASSLTYLIPTQESDLAPDWNLQTFDDSAWTPAIGNIGFDAGPDGNPVSVEGYWPLNEGTGASGDSVADLTGNHNGTLRNIESASDWTSNTPPTTFNNPYALEFDGINDHITTPFAGIGGANPRSVSLWVNTSVSDTFQPLVYWGVNTNGNRFNVRINSNASNGNVGAARVEVQGGYIIANTNIADGNWHHLTAVLPAGANNINQVQFYVDGVLESSSGGNSRVINTTLNVENVTIGNYSTNYFTGDIDDVRIYNRQLTPAEIEDLASTPTTSGLVAHWAFDDGAGTSATDSSINANHGTLINMDSDGVGGWQVDAPLQTGESNSLYFDGTDAYVETDYPGIGGTDNRSVSFWVNTTDLSNHGIVGWGDSTGTGAKYHMKLNHSAPSGTLGAPRLEVDNGFIVGNTNIADGQWHHVSFVFENDGTPNIEDVLIYVDGELETISGVLPLAFNTNISPDVADPLLIGKRNEGATSLPFAGAISDVAVFDGVLTATQITALAAGTSRPLDIPGYDPLISNDIQATMFNVNSSAFARYDFDVTDLNSLNQLTLNMQYDDGFVAFLNGTEIARDNFSGTPTWNAASDTNGPLKQLSLDISQHLPLLTQSNNVLAIQGLNSAATDDDFIINAQLTGIQIIDGIAGYFDQPTPGATNGQAFLGFTGDTTFNFDRGFYDEPFDLQITSATIDSDIYYTTDGTLPSPTNPAATLYQNPINISTTTTLRAAAFADGLIPTNVDTHTYIFTADVINQPILPDGFPATWGPGRTADYEMDPDVVNNPLYANDIQSSLKSLPVISMVSDVDFFFSPEQGIIPNSEMRGDDWEQPTSYEFFNFDNGEVLQTDGGIRMIGRASRWPSRNGKHNMRATFRSEYGDPRLNFPLFTSTPETSFDTFILRGGNGDAYINSTADENAVYTRDQFHRQTLADMGHLSNAQDYVHLYINGLYWGLYHIFERIDADFASTYLGGEPENYDILKDGGVAGVLEAEAGNLDAWNDMLDIVNGGNMDNARYNQLNDLIDLDNFIDYLLINFYTGNSDWDRSNWRAIRDRTGGQWIFLTHDSERTDINNGVVTKNTTGISNVNFPTSIHQALSTNELYQRRFADRVQLHMFNDGALTTEANIQRWSGLASQIRNAMLSESARWGDSHVNNPWTPAHWETQLQNIYDQWLTPRGDILINQLNAINLFPDINAPSFTVNNATQHGGEVLQQDAIAFVSNNNPTTTQDIIIFNQGQSAFTHIPIDDTLGTTWTAIDYTIPQAGWISGTTGVGYDIATTYDPFIGTEIETQMLGTSSSAFVRVEFNHDNSTTYSNLTLNMIYDDGFIAYLNGTEVARSTTVLTDTPGSATANGHESTTLEPFDISAFENLLVDGTNVFAIHGINVSITSGDFLLMPQLVGEITLNNPTNNPIYYTTNGTDPILDNGTPSPAAILFDEDIKLNASAIISAREQQDLNWSPLLRTRFTVDLPIRVSELHYNPDGTDDAEFIELINISNQPVNLVGLKLTLSGIANEGIQYEFLSSDTNTIIEPNQRMIIAKNLPLFNDIHPNVPAHLIADRPFTGSLNNAGETITIEDASGGTIQQFAYSDDAPWNTLPDGNGPSLDLLNPTAPKSTWNDSAAWRPSSLDQGTPGRPDPLDVALPGDFNYDGVVNIQDLAKLASNFNKNATLPPFPDIRWQHGDTNADGIINIQDLAKLASNFNKTGSDGFPTIGTAASINNLITNTTNIDLLTTNSKPENNNHHQAINFNNPSTQNNQLTHNWNHVSDILNL